MTDLDRTTEKIIAGKDAVPIVIGMTGARASIPVCLFHGGGQTRHAWRGTQQALADAGFLAIAADLRGHGDSGWSPRRDYRQDDYADDVRALVATLDRPPILVGASLGGIASVLAAGEEPRVPIAGLALVDVAANMQAAGSRAILDFMLGTVDGFDSVEEAADAVAAYLPHRPRPKSVEGLRRNLRERADGRLVWHWDPSAFTGAFDRAAMNRRLEAAARHISAPALLLRGDASELVTRAVADDYMARMPQGAVVDIPQAHHMVVGDRNDAFTAELLRFCRKGRDQAVAGPER